MSKYEKLNVKAKKIAEAISEWIYRPGILEHFQTEVCKKARELQKFDDILLKRREEKKKSNNSGKPLNELPNIPFLYYRPLGQYQLSPPIDKRKELPGFYAILANIHDIFLPYVEPVINKNIKNIFPYIDHLTLFGSPKQVTINKPLSVKKYRTLSKDEEDRISNTISNHSLQQFNQNKSLLAELLEPQTRQQIEKIKEERENHKWWDDIIDMAFRCVEGDLKNFTADDEGREGEQGLKNIQAQADNDSGEEETVNIDQLSNYESAKRLAAVYELPVGRVRSALSKAHWGPQGSKANKPVNPFLRNTIEDAGGKDTQYLWDVQLVKPILEKLKRKHIEKHKK